MYRVEFEKNAHKELKKITYETKVRLLNYIQKLAVNPRPVGCKKLVGQQDMWRIRVGNFRIIYSVFDSTLLVLVIKIGQRKDVYRDDL